MPKKIVASKTLRKEGYTHAEIAEWLGIGESTARRYQKLDTPEKFADFEHEFLQTIKLMKYDGIGKVHKRLLERIPEERRISEIVRAGEFLEGKQGTNTFNAENMQINFTLDKES